MSAIITADDASQAVLAAQAAVAALQRDIATIAAARADLNSRLPALRAERVQAAQATLLSGAPRKVWAAALQAETEAAAMLADVTVVATLLDRDLLRARWRVESAQREAHLAGLQQRLYRVAIENDLVVPESDEFLRDVAAAYGWLETAGRTADVDRKHGHDFWLDRMGAATRHYVSTQAFIAAALCHGDIAIEIGDHVAAFGLAEHNNGKPAASLPLTGDPTPPLKRLVRVGTQGAGTLHAAFAKRGAAAAAE